MAFRSAAQLCNPGRPFIPAAREDWVYEEWLDVSARASAWSEQHDGPESATSLGILIGPSDTCSGKCTKDYLSFSGQPWSLTVNYETAEGDRPSLGEWVATLDLDEVATETFTDEVRRIRLESYGDIEVRRIDLCGCDD